MLFVRLSALSSVSSLVSLLKRGIKRSGLSLKLTVVMLTVMALFGSVVSARAESTGCSQIGNSYTFSNSNLLTGAFNQGEVLSFVSATQGGEVGILGTGGKSLSAATPTYVVPTTKSYMLGLGGAGSVTIACVAPVVYTVTTNVDDPANGGAGGTAANCTAGSTIDSACSLRDAVTAVAGNTNVTSSNPGVINFSATAFPTTNTAAQNTITLASVDISLPSNITINGLTSGSGATLTNLITISDTTRGTVLYNPSGTNVTLNNLNITGGSGGLRNVGGGVTINQCNIFGNVGPYYGGGVYSSGGVLTINNSAIYNNMETGGATGGGIYMNSGVLNINNSTISGNSSAGGGGGGGIYISFSPVNLNSTTISGNSTDGAGGGLYVGSGTTTLTDTIVAGNSASGYADIDGNYTDNGGNAAGTSSAAASQVAGVALAALGFYGGPTETQPSLPSSTATFCTITSANGSAYTSLAATDQRGQPRTTAYASTGLPSVLTKTCADAGATQAHITTAYTTQTAPTYYQNIAFGSAAPVFAVLDDGAALPVTSGATFTDTAGNIPGNNHVSANFSGGMASPTTAVITAVETNDSLIGSYMYSNGDFMVTPTTNSNTFNVVVPVTGFTISTLSNAIAGAAQSVTITAIAGSSTATSFNGTATITSSDSAAIIGGATIGAGTTITFTNGVATFTNGLIFKTAGTQSITATYNAVTKTSNAVTISAGAGASVTATGSTTISVATSAAFGATALQVQVLDIYSNAVSGVTVTYAAPTSGASATLSAATCITNTSGMCAVTATANAIPGPYNISANATGASPATFSVTNTGPAVYTVTVATDTTFGTASNCTEGGTTNTNCSLRDAVAAATALPATSTIPAVINFSSTVFNTAKTITLTDANINLASYITINGATSGSGPTLTNLVSVTAPGSTIFYNPSGSNVVLNNLNITGGATGFQSASNSASTTINQCNIYGNSSPFNGAGVYVSKGTVTITNSAIYNNTETGGGVGAGLYMSGSAGAVTISNSTISGNKMTGTGGGGGGIYVGGGTLTIASSTIFNNTTTGIGGGIIVLVATANLTDTIIAGNSAANGYADLAGSANDNGGNAFGTSSANTSQVTGVALAPLGFYGGPTETQPSLPSSTATFCTITSANGVAYTSLAATDQRGQPRTTTYSTSGPFVLTRTCADAGATQAHITTAYTTQTAPTYYQNIAFGSAAPVFAVQDDGATLPVTGNATFTDTAGNIPGNNPVSANFSSGMASPSSAVITALETNDSLIGSYLYSNGAFTVTTTANSNPFNVIVGLTGFSISTLSPATAGGAQTVTITALVGSSTSTGYNGTATITSTDHAATIGGATIGSGKTITFTNGVATFTNGLVFKTAGQQSITATFNTIVQASNTVTIASSTAASISAVAGSGQSAVIGQQFTTPLAVQVLDAYSNPVAGVTVTFVTPVQTGASATLISATCTTSATAGVYNVAGGCSLFPTANGLAGGPYTVTASAATPGVGSGVSSASFTLTNNKVTPTLTVAANPTALVFAQPVTITATSMPASAGGSVPTGAVTFYDNGTAFTPTYTPASGIATYSTYAQVGSQTYAASSAGDANFAAVAKTSAAAIVVGKASSSIAVPLTQPVAVTYSMTGSIPVSIVPQYTYAAYTGASGNITYTIAPAVGGASVASGTLGLSGGAASVPVAATLAPGLYNVVVGYAGDSNLNAATSVTISLQVGKITPTVTVMASAAMVFSQTSVTLTAMVTPVANTTSADTVTFLDGAAVLATVPLVNGVAMYSTSALSTTTHSITAMYNGNTTLNTATSTNAVSLAVEDFSILGALVTTASRGGAYTSAFSIQPVGGLSFPSTITITVSGLPGGITGTLTPTTVAAGSGATSVVLSGTVSATLANLERRHSIDPRINAIAPVAFALLLLPFTRRMRRKSRGLTLMIMLLLAGAATALTGCGSGHEPEAFPITVTATSGTLSHSASVTLVVE